MCTIDSAPGVTVHEYIYMLIIIYTIDKDIVDFQSLSHVIDAGEQ